MIMSLMGIPSCRPSEKEWSVDRAKEEVQEVLNAQVESWNRGDLSQFMETYWHSPELTFVSGGTEIRGWQDTLERYRRRYQEGDAEMGVLDFAEVRVEVLGPNVALVRGQYRLQQSSGLATGRFTLVLKNLSGDWKIVYDHTSSE
jgi:beta-aspartyl-peptidase (threonine type)